VEAGAKGRVGADVGAVVARKGFEAAPELGELALGGLEGVLAGSLARGAVLLLFLLLLLWWWWWW
jgi:hypothetical protein